MSELAVATEELRLLIERIETLEAEKKDKATSITEVYAEAKGRGFDPKAMRSVIRLRRKSRDERQMEEAILETYKDALDL